MTMTKNKHNMFIPCPPVFPFGPGGPGGPSKPSKPLGPKINKFMEWIYGTQLV